MVIGKNKSLVTYDFTGTEPTENDNGIFNRGFVHTVQLIFGKL
jgi:hypothetical protein